MLEEWANRCRRPWAVLNMDNIKGGKKALMQLLHFPPGRDFVKKWKQLWGRTFTCGQFTSTSPQCVTHHDSKISNLLTDFTLQQSASCQIWHLIPLCHLCGTVHVLWLNCSYFRCLVFFVQSHHKMLLLLYLLIVLFGFDIMFICFICICLFCSFKFCSGRRPTNIPPCAWNDINLVWKKVGTALPPCVGALEFKTQCKY